MNLSYSIKNPRFTLSLGVRWIWVTGLLRDVETPMGASSSISNEDYSKEYHGSVDEKQHQRGDKKTGRILFGQTSNIISKRDV